ncbi:MAG: hypothetical protein A3D32_04815 [Candidatus Muproteobacteria bacterium RIFCSPHIGHO2_02_FULL_60_13]|nr:MAG: hypothetical protein A3D32_04815 [Candidatus Muproteobacteria bacterium RIFCSPHIGHO2_02_FULL_60_13]
MRTVITQSALGFFLCLTTAVAWAATEPLSYEEKAILVKGTHQTARVPKGFRIELLTGKLDGPRLPTLAGHGDLFIGSESGRV